MSYASIPDIEYGGGEGRITPPEVLIARAKKTYPEAQTDIEAEFLGRLDDAIENCKPYISIPRLEIDQFGLENKDGGKTPYGYLGLIESLHYPTAALVVTLTSALIVGAMHNPLVHVAYPYYACVVIFAASVPCIRQRFLDGIRPVFDKFDLMQSNIEREVEGVAEAGLHYLDVTESSMNRALAPIKQKLAGLTKIENALRQVDPTIDIPDTTDIEKSFDKYQGELKSAFEGTKHAVDVSRSLPVPLQSLSKFQSYIVVPFLAVLLILQLIAVYQINTNHRGSIPLEEDGSPFSTTGEWLVGNSTTLIENNNITTMISDDHNERHQWHLMRTALRSYLMTLLQLVIAFLVTQARAIVMLANALIAKTERNINGQLQSTVGSVFDNIFNKGFGLVKGKFLTLVRRMDKLEEPVRAVTNGIASLQSGGELLGKLGFKK